MATKATFRRSLTRSISRLDPGASPYLRPWSAMAVEKVGIVTGAAAGIGKALSKRLLELNYRVVLADINTAAGEKTQQELGSKTLFVQTDVSDYDSTAAMFKKAFEWGGRIDFFAANAGVEEAESIYVLPPANEEPPKPNLRILDVDCLSVIYGLRLFRWYVRKSGTGEGGKMVVTASQAALYPMYVAPLYCAAKSAVGKIYSVAAEDVFADDPRLLDSCERRG